MDDELLGRLRAFQETLPKRPGPAFELSTDRVMLTSEQQDLAARLAAVDPNLGISYQQVLADVAQTRDTYVGSAGEIREVLRGTIAQLAQDADVMAQPWFKGHDGKPTHAERIRYALQQNHATEDEQILKADDILDAKIGALGRSLYNRSSKALHAGTQQKEVKKVVDWVEVVLDEVLPGA
jgi:hypothetical protein